MAYIDNRFIDMLVEKADIVDIISTYTSLTRAGENYKALCPFHNEKTPSFIVSPGKRIFKCFGCGEGGNAISFVMKKENLSFIEAVKKIADMYHMEVPINNRELTDKEKEIFDKRKKQFSLHNDIAIFYRKKMLENTDNCQSYLKKRNMNKNIIRKFGIGYSPSGDEARDYLLKKGYTKEDLITSGIFKEKDGRVYTRFFNRIMFPIFDDRTRVIGFGGRRMDSGDYKYINSPETIIYHKSNNLYAFNFAMKYRAKSLILVEGYMDVIAFYKVGIAGAIASLGTSLTEEQAQKMKRASLPVFIVYDTDDAGKKATKRAINILEKVSIHPYIISLEGYKDPDDFFKEKTVDDFTNLKKNAMTSLNFLLKYLEEDYSADKPVSRSEYLKKAIEILKLYRDPIEVDTEIKRLSKKFYISEEVLRKSVNIYAPVFRKNTNFSNKKPNISIINTDNKSKVKKLFELYETYNNASLFTKDILKEEYFKEEDRKIYRELISKDNKKEKNLTEKDIENITKLANNIKINFLEKEKVKYDNIMRKSNLTDEEKIEIAEKIIDINKEINNLK